MAQYVRRRLAKSLMGAGRGGGDAEEGALPLASWHVVKPRRVTAIAHQSNHIVSYAQAPQHVVHILIT